MKKLKNIGVLAAVLPAMIFSSCSKDYLDRKPTTALETSVVLSDPDMVSKTVVGTMSMMSSYAMYGRNATIIGDMMTDAVTTVRGSNGTLKDMEEWNIHAATSEVSSFWGGGYSIAATAARTIEAINNILANNSDLSEEQIKMLNNTLASSYVQKVMAEFFLTQYFCMDYGTAINKNINPGKANNNEIVGIMLLNDKPLVQGEPANMSTLKKTYGFMIEQLKKAVTLFDSSGNTSYYHASDPRYFPTKCAAQALLAKIYLNMHDYANAIAEADNALLSLPAGASATLINDADALYESYGATASSEDIWTLNYTTQDNLSANSLNNLFGSYGANGSEKALAAFKNSDIRKGLYVAKPDLTVSKSTCYKYKNDNGVFNVPLIRVPELYLIKAEAYAWQDQIPAAQEALLNVIGARDTLVETLDDLKSNYSEFNGTKEAFITGLLNENMREFLGEGHRWTDLRRCGARLDRTGGGEKKKYQLEFSNYPIGVFCFPVPYDETSTEQWISGRGIKDDGTQAAENWQNNVWNNKTGNTYSIVDDRLLPKADQDYKNDYPEYDAN